MPKLSNKKIRNLRILAIFLAVVILCCVFFGVSSLRAKGLKKYLKEVPMTFSIKPLETSKIDAADSSNFTELNPIGENAHKVAENEFLILYIEDDYSGIRVYDKKTQKSWYSVVSDDGILENPDISEMYKDSMKSFFTFSYIDLSSGSTKLTNTSSIKEEFHTDENSVFGGVRLVYDFTKLNITISVDITIDGGSLVVNIPEDGIKENKPKKDKSENKVDKKVEEVTDICTQIKDAAEKNSQMRSNEKLLIDMSVDEIMSSLVNISSQAASGYVEELNYDNISTTLDTLSIVSLIYEDINSLFEKLTAEIDVLRSLTAEVSDNRCSGLIELSVLPYFGAQKLGEDGYAFYPDGCGAISYFNVSHPLLSGTYTQRVYDRDRNDVSYIEDEEGNIFINSTTVPVYGIKSGDSAFLAMITEGEYDSQINYIPCTISQNIATAYGSYIMRQMSSVVNSSSNTVSTYDEDLIKTNRTTRYVFLQDEKANYSGMAATYRDYLKDTNQLQVSSVMKKEKMPLALDFFIGYDTEKKGMNDSYISITSFDGIKNFVQKLDKKGINNQFLYLDNWKENYGNCLVTDFVPSKEAGGKNSLSELSEYIKNSKNHLILEGQYVETAEEKLNSAERDVAIVKTKSLLNFLNDGMAMLNPTFVYNKTKKVGLNSIEELGINTFDMGDMSRSLYFDYNENAVSNREGTANIFRQLANDVSNEKECVVGENANAYIYGMLDWNRDVPENGSNFLYTDETVPFIQMVLHGSMIYTGTPFNEVFDEQQQLLKAVEYGYIPSYYLTEESPIEISTAGLSGFYSTQFTTWENKICETYETLNNDLNEVWNKTIVSHEKVEEDVYSVLYENGVKIIVNYTENDVTVDGSQIKALDYCVIKN